MLPGLRSCRIAVLCLLLVSPALAQEKPAPSKILFVTQSAGFKHSSVTRKDGQLAPAEVP